MPVSSHFDAISRNNLGAIIIALFVVSYYICKTYYKIVKKKFTAEFTKYTSSQVSINLPLALTEGVDPQHIRIRCLGGSYVIIKCPKLVWNIFNNAEIFESATFTSQTFNLSLSLLGIRHERKNFKKLLNVVLRTRTSPPEAARFTDATLKNSVEYPIHSNELPVQTTVVIPSLLANNGKKPYSPKLYPSLATKESNDTETRAAEYPATGHAAQKSTSKIDPNMELLLPERFVEQKEHRALKECYYNISEPFTLMKVQTDHLTAPCDTRVMNSNNTLITQKSPRLNANENAICIRQSTLREFDASFLLAKYCIKELIVLLEAKSNRRDTVDINEFSYRHAVNTLGVCLFGKHINQLSSSRCQFYQVCDHLIEILREQHKNKLVRYVNDLRRHFQSSERPGRRVQEIVEFFNRSAEDCLAGRYEGYENSLISILFQQFADDLQSQNDHYEQLKGTISAFLISFTVNVLEILSGNMSLILHHLAKDVEFQEKIRNNDEVEFDLEGFPLLNSQNLRKSNVTDSVIEEAFENYAVDPITPFICKYPYRIPETKILVNPTCVILVPRHVLRSSQQQIDCEGKWPERATPPGSFIVDLETQSFNLFVEEFVKICLKLSVTSLLRQYIFTADETCIDQQREIANTSCRFTTLPSNIFVKVNRVDKRGKIITFEESLKAFHTMKNARLSWRSILSKCFPLIPL